MLVYFTSFVITGGQHTAGVMFLEMYSMEVKRVLGNESVQVSCGQSKEAYFNGSNSAIPCMLYRGETGSAPVLEQVVAV